MRFRNFTSVLILLATGCWYRTERISCRTPAAPVPPDVIGCGSPVSEVVKLIRASRTVRDTTQLNGLLAIPRPPNRRIEEAATSVATDREATLESRVAAIQVLLGQEGGESAFMVVRDWGTANAPQGSLYEFTGPPLHCLGGQSTEHLWNQFDDPTRESSERVREILVRIAHSTDDERVVRNVAACAAGISI